jgi:hypothetical protein
MTATRPLVATAVLLSTLAAPMIARDRDRAHIVLKDFFEGQRVTVRLDMPATSEGVNLHLDNRRAFNDGRRPMDFEQYRNDLRRYGVAIRAGESVMVTLVKVKDDLIEFQLGGGGYGTFFDDTDTSANIPFIEKSERERSLERRIREENDRDRRRLMERELDGLRDRRERDNRRIRAERERLSEYKRDRIAFRRLQAGSRFNLRYRNRVPSDVRPEDVMAALAEYVEFDDARARYRR